MLHAPLTLTTAKLDISLLLKPSPSPPPPPSPAPTQDHPSRSTSVPAPSHQRPLQIVSHRTSNSSNLSTPSRYAESTSASLQPYPQSQRPTLPPILVPASSYLGPQLPSQPQIPPSSAKRSLPAGSHPAASPAKKQSKWTPEEDALIIELRGSGMKWEDISKRLPGRSAISCRLHYQNYLERRSEWDEEKKNRLARLYERLKPDMWAPLASELGIPWRAAEAMHWQLGENDMARRAGVTPFSLAGGVSAMSGSGPGPGPGPSPGLGPPPVVSGYQPGGSIGLPPGSLGEGIPGIVGGMAMQDASRGGGGLPGVAELESGRYAPLMQGRVRYPGPGVGEESSRRRDGRDR